MRFRLVGEPYVNPNPEKETIVVADILLAGKFDPGESAYLRFRALEARRKIPSCDDPIIRVTHAALATNCDKGVNVEVFRYPKTPPSKVTIRLALPDHPKQVVNLLRQTLAKINLDLAVRSELNSRATGEVID